jgi:hypothetical protein
MKKSELRKQNQYLERDIQNLVCHTFESAGIETAIRWKTYFDSQNSGFVREANPFEKEEHKPKLVRVPLIGLSDESIIELMKKPYVPRYVIIEGFRTDNTSGLPWLATFLIPPDEFPNSGYNTHLVKVGVTLKKSFIDEFKTKKS